jgi:hypothetical protein
MNVSVSPADERPHPGTSGGLDLESHQRSRRTAFAIAGLGGNNAHGAGFLSAAQELQRQRRLAVSATRDGESSSGSESMSAQRRAREARLILPELEFISCTSGAIASTVTYLKGGDVRAEMESRIAAVERAGWLPRNAWMDTWRGPVVALWTGVPNVFGPAAEAYAQHWWKRLTGFVDPASRRFGAVPTTLDEVLDLFFPARVLVPKLPREFFVEAAEAFTDRGHGVGVAFNSFDPNTGIEQLYVNDAALGLIVDHYDPHADYGATHRRSIYRPITPEAVRSALWLFGYGFPDGDLEPSQDVDGAYARSIILNELTFADRIYAVKPTSDRWIGRLPQNSFEVQDMQTEFWWEASYREQSRLIETISDLEAAGRLSERITPGEGSRPDGRLDPKAAARIDVVSRKNYRRLELIPVEMGMQRGFFTYFAEDRGVFTEAFGRSLRLLATRDEQDAYETGRSSRPAQHVGHPLPHACPDPRRIDEAATEGSRGPE